MSYISVEIDIEDYIHAIPSESLLNELNRRGSKVQTSLEKLDEDTEFPIQIKGMDDVVKRDILVEWLSQNFKRLSIAEFEQEFK